MEIVLVNTSIYQKYIINNIYNLVLFGNTNITVITEPEIANQITTDLSGIKVNFVFTDDLDILNFDQKTKMPKGVGENAKLFYIYSYMEKHSKNNVLHIENDYLIYFNESNLPDLQNCIWLTTNVPGIVYIPSPDLLKGLIENYDMYKSNNKTICKKFPLMPDEQHFELFEMIFDAGAIGQYLNGHAVGDVPLETFYVTFSDYQFYWKIEQVNGKLLYIQVI